MKTYDIAKQDFEYKYLIQLLKKAKGWKTKASTLSGLSRIQLDRMLHRHNIIIELEIQEDATQ